ERFPAGTRIPCPGQPRPRAARPNGWRPAKRPTRRGAGTTSGEQHVQEGGTPWQPPGPDEPAAATFRREPLASAGVTRARGSRLNLLGSRFRGRIVLPRFGENLVE